MPAGRPSERLGARSALRLSGVASGAVLVATAAAGHSFATFLVLLLLAGVANSLAFASANVTVGRVIRRQGVGLGLLQSALPVATLLSGLSLPYVGAVLGWRWVFLGAALLPLVVYGSVPAHDGHERVEQGTRARRVGIGPKALLLLLLALAGGFAFSSGAALGTFTVESAIAAGHDARFSGLLLSLGSVAAILVRVVSGFAVERLRYDPLRLVSGMLLLGALGYLALATHRSAAWLALGTVLAFGAGWGWTGVALFVAIRMYARTPAVAAGMVGTGLCLGGVVGPPAHGVHGDRGRFRRGLAGGGGCHGPRRPHRGDRPSCCPGGTPCPDALISRSSARAAVAGSGAFVYNSCHHALGAGRERARGSRGGGRPVMSPDPSATPTEPRLWEAQGSAEDTPVPSRAATRAPPHSPAVSLRTRLGSATRGASGILVLLSLMALWELSVVTGAVDTPTWPRFSIILLAFAQFVRSGTVIDVFAPSLWRLAAGYSIAMVSAIAAGMAMGYFKPVHRLFEPLVEILRPIPSPAYIPMAILFLGIGNEMKIFMIAFACFFPIVVNTVSGVQNVEPVLLDTAKTLGLDTREVVRKIVLPAAATYIAAGMRISLAIALIITVIAEMVAGNDGIGFYILSSQRSFRISEMYAAVVALAILGYSLNRLFVGVEARLLAWSPAIRNR